MKKILIVSPSIDQREVAETVNGNSRTAERWAQMLTAQGYNVRAATSWASGDEHADLLIALHARRSASSIDAWVKTEPRNPFVLVLTGTDLYRDIRTDATAKRSMAEATRLVVLQPNGLNELSESDKVRANVIYQSAPRRESHRSRRKGQDFRVVMVGHLREEKDPATYLRAAHLLQGAPGIQLSLIGAGLDLGLMKLAMATQAQISTFTYLGAQSHQKTLEAISAADLLVHTSRLEGGAHVILEALQSGTPVLASNIGGNVGMLDDGYPGLFELGNEFAMVALIRQCATDANFYDLLVGRCASFADRFNPVHESNELRRLMMSFVNPADAKLALRGSQAG